MRPLRPTRPLLGLAALGAIAWASPTVAQDVSEAADSLAIPDSVGPRPAAVREDPRLTWLGDTLAAPADSLHPRFSELPEVSPDSLVDPYLVERPGAWPEWVLSDDALLGRGAFSLLDILESEGLFLTQDLGGGGLGVFLGTPQGTATSVQVVVDGVPAGDPLAAAWDLRQIPLEAIARVAWYPGAQTAAWGGDCTGGVLSIITRRQLAPGARSLLAFLQGSFDAQAFSGSFGRPVTDRGDLFAAVNFDTSEGPNRTGDFTRNQTFAKAGWRLGSRHRLDVSRRGDGLSGTEFRANLEGEEDHDASVWRLAYVGSVGPLAARAVAYRERHTLASTFAYRNLQGVFGDSERSGVQATVAMRRGPLLAWGGAVRGSSEASSPHPLFLRGDGTSLLEDPDPDAADTARVTNPRRRTELAGGLGLGGAGDRLTGNAALRRIDFGEAAEAGTAWQAEGAARPGANFTLRAAIGRAVRPADLPGQALLTILAAQQLEIHPGRLAEPRALETWTTWRGEAAWARDGWRARAAAFGASGEGAFLWLPPTAWLYVDPAETGVFSLGEPGFNTFDVVDLTARGLDVEAWVPLPYGVRGRLWYRALDFTEDVSGEQVPYTPRHLALGQLRYARRFFPSRDLLVEARLTGRYTGERTTVGAEPLQDFLAADALVQATVINFTVFLSLKNLAGVGYLTDENFALPGRESFLGITWRFRN
ncbi:MAG: TonB-dependent receptor plug domain-containing protein [Gemmatimonadota bacterium]